MPLEAFDPNEHLRLRLATNYGIIKQALPPKFLVVHISQAEKYREEIRKYCKSKMARTQLRLAGEYDKWLRAWCAPCNKWCPEAPQGSSEPYFQFEYYLDNDRGRSLVEHNYSGAMYLHPLMVEEINRVIAETEGNVPPPDPCPPGYTKAIGLVCEQCVGVTRETHPSRADCARCVGQCEQGEQAQAPLPQTPVPLPQTPGLRLVLSPDLVLQYISSQQPDKQEETAPEPPKQQINWGLLVILAGGAFLWWKWRKKKKESHET